MVGSRRYRSGSVPLDLTGQSMAAPAEIINKRDQSRRRERLFYTGMSVAFVITVFAGFAPTFYLRSYFQTQPLIPLLLLHGFVFTSWVAPLLPPNSPVFADPTTGDSRVRGG